MTDENDYSQQREYQIMLQREEAKQGGLTTVVKDVSFTIDVETRVFGDGMYPLSVY